MARCFRLLVRAWFVGVVCCVGGLLSDLLVGLACVAEFFHSFVLVAICTGIACVLYLRSQFLFSLCYTCQPPRSQGLSSPPPSKGSEERKTLVQAGHVSW